MQGLIGHLTSHEEAHGARSRDIMLQLLGGKRGGGVKGWGYTTTISSIARVRVVGRACCDDCRVFRVE